MSDSIDDLVVFAEFDNKAFNSKIAESLKALENFEKGLEMKDATKGLAGIDAAADNLDFSGVFSNISGISKAIDAVNLESIAAGVDHIASRFTAMGAVAFAVIQRMTNAAIDFAKQTANLVFDPLMAGGRSRALNIEAAKFQFKGLGIDVTAGMESALAAVKGTAYGLDEAAKVAAQFGASGIKAGQDMTDALRGISGAAAMTGSSFTEIGQIYTGIAGMGKVTNQDFMQFAVRGLNAAAAIGKVLGKTEAQIHEMAANGEIDFKTFAKAMDTAFGEHATKANETYTGALANLNAALSRIGASFIAPYLEGLRKVFNALTPAIDAVAKALGPFVDLWTVLTTVISNKIVSFLEGLNFDPLVLAIALISQGLGSFIGVLSEVVSLIGEAFGNEFLKGPKSLGAVMVDLAQRFSDFLKSIKPSQETMDKLRIIFSGVASVVRIVVEVIKIAAKAIGELFQSLNYNNGNAIIDFFVQLAEWISGAAEAIKGFNWNPIKLAMFFIGSAIANVIEVVGRFVGAFKEAWQEVFPAGDKGEAVGTTFAKIADAINRWSESIKPTVKDLRKFKDNVVEFLTALKNAPANIKNKFNEIVDSIQNTIDKVKEFFGFGGKEDAGTNRLEQRAEQAKTFFEKVKTAVQKFLDFIQPAIEAIKDFFSDLMDKFKEAFGPGDYNGIVDLVNVGLLGGIAYLLKSFMDGSLLEKLGLGSMKDGGWLKNLIGEDTLNSVTGAFDAMQKKLNAETLMNIAKAIALVAASVLVLSLIDSVALTKALVAMAVGFGQLATMMEVMERTIQDPDKLETLAGAMILIAGAMLVLSLSVKLLSGLDPAELATGLGGVLTLLGAMTLVMKQLEADKDGMVKAAFAMIGISIAIGLLAVSVAALGQLNPGELAAGLGAVALMLTGLVTALNKLTEDTDGMVKAAFAMIGISIAVGLLAASVKVLSDMNLTQLAKGLGAVALMMGGLVFALQKITEDTAGLVAASAAMVGMALAILIISKAVEALGALKLGDLGKGLGAIVILLAALAIAANSMEAALPGAGAMLVMALAVKVLADVMQGLAKLKIGQILAAIGAIAGVVLVIAGLAAAALAFPPIIAAIAALGGALVIFGLGLALVGAGVFLLGKGLEAIAKAGPEAAKGIVEMIGILQSALPVIVHMVANAIISFVDDLITAAPVLIKGLAVILDQLLETVQKLLPKLFEVVGELIDGLVKMVVEKGPSVITAGLFILTQFLQGIRANIGQLTQLAIDIVTRFGETIQANMPQLVGIATGLITSFVTELGNHAEELAGAGTQAFTDFMGALTEDVDAIVEAITTFITNLITELGNHAEEMTGAGTAALVSFLDGLANDVDAIALAVQTFFSNLVTQLFAVPQGVADAGAQALVKFLNGIAENIQQVCDAAQNVIRKFASCLGELGGLVLGAGAGQLGNFLLGIASRIGELITSGAQAVGNFILGIVSRFGEIATQGRKAVGEILTAVQGRLGELVAKGSSIAGHLIQGIVQRLKEGLSEVTSLAKDIGKKAAEAFGLGALVNSPSKITLEIGGYIVEGLTKGMQSNSGAAINTAEALGHDTASAVQNSLSRALESISGLDDISPVIAPVLDLSKVEGEASKLGDMLNVSSIVPSVSMDNANLISSTAEELRQESADAEAAPSSVVNHYEQTINSPKALSTGDIYRQSKSLFAIEKKELETV